jgi:hypothetical protein
MKETPHRWKYTIFTNGQFMVISDAEFGCVIAGHDPLTPFPDPSLLARIHAERVLEAQPELLKAKGNVDIQVDSFTEDELGLPPSLMDAVLRALYPGRIWSDSYESFTDMHTQVKSASYPDWKAFRISHSSVKFIFTALDRIEKALHPKRGKDYSPPCLLVGATTSDNIAPLRQQYLCFQYGDAWGVLLCSDATGQTTIEGEPSC